MALQRGRMSLMRIILWCTFLASILVAYIYISDANMSERVSSTLIREKLSPEEIDAANYTKFHEEVQARTDRIKTEISKLKNHPWAGEYSSGMGGYLAISPHQGAVLASAPCIVMYGARTSVHQNAKGWLELSPEKNEKFGYRAFDGALVPVHWGKRRYLIPEADLQRFTTDINLGLEPRTGSNRPAGNAYLAVGDEQKLVSGLPDLPAEYLKKIRTVAVEANVRDVKLLKTNQNEYNCTREYRVTLNKGSADGLAEGDTLRLINPNESYDRIDLLEVRNNSATARVFVATKNCTDTSKSPNQSWKYTTGAYVAP